MDGRQPIIVCCAAASAGFMQPTQCGDLRVVQISHNMLRQNEICSVWKAGSDDTHRLVVVVDLHEFDVQPIFALRIVAIWKK